MKRIEATLQKPQIDDVCAALRKAGHAGFTTSQVEEHGSRDGWLNQIRSVSHEITYRAKIRLEVIVTNEDAGRIVETIRDAALAGETDDGRIFIHDIADAIRIRTNESSATAR